MTDAMNRAIRQAAGKGEPTHDEAPTDKEWLAKQKEERRQSAVMSRILRAAAGVPDDSEPPASRGHSAKEQQ